MAGGDCASARARVFTQTRPLARYITDPRAARMIGFVKSDSRVHRTDASLALVELITPISFISLTRDWLGVCRDKIPLPSELSTPFRAARLQRSLFRSSGINLSRPSRNQRG